MATTVHHSADGLPAPARAGIAVAGTVVGGVFGAVSRLRDGKSLHPHGVVHEARLCVRGDGPPELLAGVPLLAEPGSHRGVVRFSRSLGLPESVPDFMGLALRLTDAYGPDRPQDLLLISSGDGAVVHHLFRPGFGYFAHPYSSVLIFRGDGDAFVVGARLRPGAPAPAGNGSEFADLDVAAATGELRYDVGVAPVNGRMVPAATLEVGARLPDEANDIRFNPWNTGGGLEPTGPINRIRDWVYPRSQAGWAHDSA